MNYSKDALLLTERPLYRGLFVCLLDLPGSLLSAEEQLPAMTTDPFFCSLAPIAWRQDLSRIRPRDFIVIAKSAITPFPTNCEISRQIG